MSFSSETSVKATRKPAQCAGCTRMIDIGQPATRWAGINSDRDFASVAYHPECRAAEVAFNELRGTYGDEWGGLDELEPEDRVWLEVEHPAVFARIFPDSVAQP